MGEVAGRTPFRLQRRVFVDEGPEGFGMTLGTNRVLIGSGPQ